MNALVTFRANAVGNYSPTRTQRESAAAQISALLQAKHAVARGLQKAAAQAPTVSKADGSEDATSTVSGHDELSRDAFLQLLVMELRNQDPTNPIDSTDMISQLAQFSALEAAMSLNESFDELTQRFEALVGNVDQLNFISAQGLLGNYVQGTLPSGALHGGLVEAVHLDGSIVVLTVDGQPMPMTGVLSIATEAKASAGASGSATEAGS